MNKMIAITTANAANAATDTPMIWPVLSCSDDCEGMAVASEAASDVESGLD